MFWALCDFSICPSSFATYMHHTYTVFYTSSTSFLQLPWQMTHSCGISVILWFPPQLRHPFHNFIQQSIEASMQRLILPYSSWPQLKPRTSHHHFHLSCLYKQQPMDAAARLCAQPRKEHHPLGSLRWVLFAPIHSQCSAVLISTVLLISLRSAVIVDFAICNLRWFPPHPLCFPKNNNSETQMYLQIRRPHSQACSSTSS